MPAQCNGGFDAAIARRGGTTTVVVSGEVDMVSADDFRAALDVALGECPGRLEIDLRRTTFMDSTGLALLMEAHRRLGQAREAIVVIDPAPNVRRLLDISGVAAYIDIRSDLRAPGGR